MAQTTHFASFVPVLVVVSRACPLCPLLPCPLLHRLFGPSEVVVDAFGTACFCRHRPFESSHASKKQIEPN